jgi:hypothetical protein
MIKGVFMRNLTKFLGIIALVAIIGFTMIACGDGGGGSGGDTQKTSELNSEDQNSNLTVPTSPAGIPNFKSSKGYSAITKNEAEEFVAELEKELQNFVKEVNQELSENGGISGILNGNFNYGRSAFGRATLSYDIDDSLSNILKQYLGNDYDEVKKVMKIDGYIKGTASISDNEENPFPVTANGSAEFKVELLDGFELGGGYSGYDPEIGYYEEYFVEYEARGFVAGTASINNVRINSADSMSGSVSATANYAVNLAFVEEGKWVKLIGNVTVTANLGSQTASATATLSAYGDGTSPLITKTITASATSNKVTVTIR